MTTTSDFLAGVMALADECGDDDFDSTNEPVWGIVWHDSTGTPRVATVAKGSRPDIQGFAERRARLNSLPLNRIQYVSFGRLDSPRSRASLLRETALVATGG